VHGFPVAAAAAAGVQELSTRAWVESCWSRGQAPVLALLGPRDGAALARLIESCLGEARSFAYRPCLLYADFAPERILYDADGRAIVGTIDWGDLAIGDPDFDLLYLRQDYGEAFVRRLLGHYPHPEPGRLLRKLRVFAACDQVATIASSQGAAGRADIEEAVAAVGEILAQR
jgi:aminoglycoside 2''-phosphotransferase